MSVRNLHARLVGLLLAAVLLAGAGAFSVHNASAASANQLRKGPGHILPRAVTSTSIARGVTAPAYTTSLYESTTYYGTLQNQGCNAARGPSGVVVLDFGEPDYSGGTYGTYDFGGHFDSDNAIYHAVANFAYGAWNCRVSTTNLAVAIGTSNY